MNAYENSQPTYRYWLTLRHAHKTSGKQQPYTNHQNVSEMWKKNAYVSIAVAEVVQAGPNIDFGTMRGDDWNDAKAPVKSRENGYCASVVVIVVVAVVSTQPQRNHRIFRSLFLTCAYRSVCWCNSAITLCLCIVFRLSAFYWLSFLFTFLFVFVFLFIFLVFCTFSYFCSGIFSFFFSIIFALVVCVLDAFFTFKTGHPVWASSV